MSTTSSMSKRRYKEIGDKLRDLIGDEGKYEEAMRSIREIMNYDPEKTIKYTAETGRRIKEYRERKKEQGISTYVSSGAKAYYHKHKETV
jgi:hypothetical protein